MISLQAVLEFDSDGVVCEGFGKDQLSVTLGLERVVGKLARTYYTVVCSGTETGSRRVTAISPLKPPPS